MNRLFFGNLNYKTDEASLRTYVESHQFAVDSVSVVTDKETGRSKGFGFVDLQDEGDMDAAIEKMNRQELDSRTINVDRARNRPPKPRDSGNDYERNDRQRRDRR